MTHGDVLGLRRVAGIELLRLPHVEEQGPSVNKGSTLFGALAFTLWVGVLPSIVTDFARHATLLLS